jgi:hypothetical protein
MTTPRERASLVARSALDLLPIRPGADIDGDALQFGAAFGVFDLDDHQIGAGKIRL